MDIKSYLCGLIAADGHLESNGYVMLAQKDKRFIDWLLDVIKSNNIRISSVFFDKKANVWKIKLRDKEFYNYLLNNGLSSGKKAALLRPPKSCDSFWYIIGFIDGDGWVEQVRKKVRDKMYYYLPNAYTFLSTTLTWGTAGKPPGCTRATMAGTAGSDPERGR